MSWEQDVYESTRVRRYETLAGMLGGWKAGMLEGLNRVGPTSLLAC